ncbi:Rid family hydrolase [Phytohabitans sp. LJ34]|uniref:Rid family hydrolase n=1 Tax=Phytohabitans sp. LJ34 TaxID=3452217 RepID=UPI003F8C9943
MRLSRRLLALALPTAAVSATMATPAAAHSRLRPTEVKPNLPAGQSNPLIANGVSVGGLVALYRSSGTGPAARNTSAPAGTPEAYVDPAQFPGAALPAGVTLTEAQSWNALARIGENLAAVKLRYADVISMRVFLDNPPGAATADYAGWNRAYRQFFANVDLVSGAVVPVPLGSAPPAPPQVANRARPSRTTIEVASLPVPGWLVEVEVEAVLR